MQGATRSWIGRMVAGGLFVGLLTAGGAVRAGEDAPKVGEEELYIATDRVVGFVPLKVLVYGKIRSTAPERIELCRSEVKSLVADTKRRTEGRRRSVTNARRISEQAGIACAPAKIVPTPDGYDHAYEMRFDRPGTYQVRLMMVDQSGRRSVSNTVQVRAF